MTQPERTPEQHDAVRRRALPVAIGGFICGLAGVLLPFLTTVNAATPPNLLAMNLAFCALLIGAGILFYVKGTPGTRAAAFLCILTILLGMAGTLLYTRQAVQSRSLREDLERSNVAAIARAARDYAADHAGTYPADLLVLLEEKRLAPQTLRSPYGNPSDFFDRFDAATTQASRADLLQSVETASDYDYLGSDLKSIPADLAGKILVASSKRPVLRISLAVGFADATSRYITLEEMHAVIDACNDARHKVSLGDFREPAVIRQAMEETAPTTKK